MNLGDTDKAINHYEKAASNSTNIFTAPIYHKRAALAHENIGNFNEALTHYEIIKKNYGNTQEGTDIEKYITKVSLMR